MEKSFLREKYGLHKSHEVERAAKRTEKRTGKKLTLDTVEGADARIQNYLDRLKSVIHPARLAGHEGFERGERNLETLKRSLYDQFVIKPEDIPEAYFESVKKRHEEEGRPLDEIPGDIRKELAETITTDQKNSLDEWVDYLASDDAKYPDYLKYFAFRSILRMGRYDKKKKAFSERTGGAIAPFPDLNREALAIVLESFERQERGEPVKFGYDIEEATKQSFLQLLKQKNFAKLYALAVEEFKPIPEELLKVTEGTWIAYPQGSDPMRLVESIAPYGTGWCLRGESMARRYLQGNDLEIFYSLDKEGKPTVPRAVIVSAGGIISEVRGVAEDEHIDPRINNVIKEKLAAHPDGQKYEKKASDMETLTAIKKKTGTGATLSKDDLIFLYEINAPIESFGYGTNDPRVRELRSQRNPEEDMAVVFECEKDQIARDISEIKEDTKAYVGSLVPGIFDKVQRYGIEHVYTSFPEGRIRKEQLEIGGKDAKTLINEMREKKINISDYAMDMLKSKDFTVLKKSEEEILIRLKVGDLGFPKDKYPTTDEVYKRIEELGLELCPAETGPHYRLKYANQPLNKWFRIGMKQIADRDGNPDVFYLARYGGGLWLYGLWTGPGDTWDPDDEFVFRLRKLKNLKT
ncbi:MAG: hypothetical protein HY434_02845 [Candidatus Liptonbacteria bacterium]|nr:hypothetical protein [Candidatus Liptonbacteria bacterium]